MMICYYCPAVDLKILKAKIRHKEYQFDKPDLLTKQMFVPSFKDVSFICPNNGRGRRIQELRVTFCKNFLLGLKKIVGGNVVSCRYTTYLQFECQKYKFYKELLKKQFFLLALSQQYFILFDHEITALDFMRYVGYRL